jgi:hypothetical protein
MIIIIAIQQRHFHKIKNEIKISPKSFIMSSVSERERDEWQGRRS